MSPNDLLEKQNEWLQKKASNILENLFYELIRMVPRQTYKCTVSCLTKWDDGRSFIPRENEHQKKICTILQTKLQEAGWYAEVKMSETKNDTVDVLFFISAQSNPPYR